MEQEFDGPDEQDFENEEENGPNAAVLARLQARLCAIQEAGAGGSSAEEDDDAGGDDDAEPESSAEKSETLPESVSEAKEVREETAANEPLAAATRCGWTSRQALRQRPSPFGSPLKAVTEDLRDDPRLARPAPPPLRNGKTEELLNGIIAECHFFIREMVLPSAMQCCDADERRNFLSSAIEFAQTGATVAKAVAKLRRNSPLPGATLSQVEEHLQVGG